MKNLTKLASEVAHGKIILIGEHSVVYNEPAIAIPLTSLTVEVTIREIEGESTIGSIYHVGKIKDAPVTLNNIIKTLNTVCVYLNVSPDNLHIEINSNIPPERGMGSSAAVGTALVRALFSYFNKELTAQSLRRFVLVSEKIAHGNPSGLDVEVVSSKQAIYYIKNKITEFFTLNLPGYLVIADTGEQSQTRTTVKDVEALVTDKEYSGQKQIKALGNLTKEAYQLIIKEDIDQLGTVLSKAQHYLHELTISNEKLNVLIQTALDNGALGAKLTGGGRGGCMIALIKEKEEAKHIEKKLVRRGAIRTWIHPLGEHLHE